MESEETKLLTDMNGDIESPTNLLKNGTWKFLNRRNKTKFSL